MFLKIGVTSIVLVILILVWIAMEDLIRRAIRGGIKDFFEDDFKLLVEQMQDFNKQLSETNNKLRETNCLLLDVKLNTERMITKISYLYEKGNKQP